MKKEFNYQVENNKKPGRKLRLLVDEMMNDLEQENLYGIRVINRVKDKFIISRTTKISIFNNNELIFEDEGELKLSKIYNLCNKQFNEISINGKAAKIDNIFTNPKYNNLTVIICINYTKTSLNRIEKIKKRNQRFMNKINLDEFTEEQLHEIYFGLKENCDVKRFAKPEFTPNKMKLISIIGYKDYEEIFNDPQFNEEQLQKIEYGILNKLNIRAYADYFYEPEQMEEIIIALEKGIPLHHYVAYSNDSLEMEQIRLGLEAGIDVTKYNRGEYDANQMEQIRLGLERGLDISTYNNPKFDSDQMDEIRLGLEAGIDVTKYNNYEYTWDQMSIIRKGLECDIDISKYINSDFYVEQMIQILLGLEEELDITKYNDSNINAKEMEKIRLQLLKEKIRNFKINIIE